MIVNVTGYYNTGFNASNIPDSPATLLTSAEYTRTFDAIDILQDLYIGSIRLRATWAEIKDCDYIQLTDTESSTYYYTVISVNMHNSDTAEVVIMLDGYLTAGGVNGFEILDGLTDRHHISKNDDIFGAYTEDDPYIIPSKPLTMVQTDVLLKRGGSESGGTIIISTLDLIAMATANTGLTYIDNDNKECTVPQVIAIQKEGILSIQDPSAETETTRFINLPSVMVYDGDDTTVQEGIARARSLGVESGILNQYYIPPQSGVEVDFEQGIIYCHKREAETGLNYEYADVRNKRVLTGELNQYGLVAISTGNTAYFRPEDIYKPDDSAPKIISIADGRASGCPYFRYQYFKGLSTNFFLNAITGMIWQNAPLVYYDKSGSVLDTYKLSATQKLRNSQADLAYQTERNILNFTQQGLEYQYNTLQYKQKENIGGTIGAAGASLLSILGGAGAQGLSSSIAAISNGFDKGFTIADNMYQNVTQQNINNERLYNAQGVRQLVEAQNAMERDLLGASNTIVAPSINYQLSETLRDIVGNGVIAFRYRFAASDVTKIDKILTMYGYKDCAVLTKALFTNRPHFNYIKTNGVTIQHKNRNIASIIQSQLQGGIRIWHVKPNPTYYTQNE